MKTATLKKIIKNPLMIIPLLGHRGLTNWIPDKTYLQMAYKAEIGHKLHLNPPVTFTEKLQWIKLYDHNPLYTKLVDKYQVREFVKKTIGEEYLIPFIGRWDNPGEIDFNKLPEQFVLKCNHDSGSIVVCRDKDKFDAAKAKKRLGKHLEIGTYYYGREWPYKDVKPCIIAESFIEDSSLHELRDYKFFCFSGKVQFYKVDFDRFTSHGANYYDVNGELLPFYEKAYPAKPERIVSPDIPISKMITLAEKLAESFRFMRVDFYYANSKIYFGEMTLFPASGFGPFVPDEYDKTIGDMLDLE